MTTENMPYIQEVIAEVLFSTVVQETLNAVESNYNVKFALYNHVNLGPNVISHSSCPVHAVPFAVEFNKNVCKLCIVTTITDADFLQIFQDEKNKGEQEIEQEVDIESEKDKYGREHVSYPHTGPSTVYIWNNFFYKNKCLEHLNDFYRICFKSRKRGKKIFIVVADNG